MIRKIAKRIFLLAMLFLGIFYFASSSLALENDWPASPASKISFDDNITIPEMIKYFYEWGISLGGLAVFIVLLLAGVQYLTSFGDPGKMKDALGRIQSAFFGLILLLSSYMILNVINPELTGLVMPTINPVDYLESIDPESFPPTTIPPCTSVRIYSEPNYNGTETIVGVGSCQCANININQEKGSLKMIAIGLDGQETKGACYIELYSTNVDNCKRTSDGKQPVYTLYSDTSDIGTLYLGKNIKCVKVFPINLTP
jgi:hypothetical protein